ncbi:MAG TPA: hypothetical protein VNY73_06465 [Bacteroidia bacterium]|nr:hypothetical protein [Bacteroidia bacterium]
MFKNLNSGKKLKWLGAVILLALVLVYFLAIKETLHLAGDCRLKEQKLQQSKQLEQTVVLLRNEIKNLDRQIGSQPDTTRKVMDLLLDNITEYCNSNGCTIKEIPAAAQAVNNGYEIETYFITLEGSFKQLLSLAYLLEQKKKTGGHIASLLFQVTKNNNTKKQELLLTLYVQHYNKI